MQWLFILGTFLLGTLTGMTTFSQGAFWRRQSGVIVNGALSCCCFISIGFGFWKYSFILGVAEVVAVFTGGALGVQILGMLGFEAPLFEHRAIDPEQIARDIWSGESTRKVAKENELAEKDIQTALNDPEVQKVMQETGLTEKELRDIHRRVRMYGNIRIAAKAIRNAQLLKWCYEKSAAGEWMEQDMGIVGFVKYRRVPST